MENKELYESIQKDIETTKARIKEYSDNKDKLIKELKKLNIELRRKEQAKAIYFNEKSKKLKKVKEFPSEEKVNLNKSKEVINNG